MWELGNGLIGNLGYIFLVAFTMVKSRIFKKSIRNDIQSKKDILILSLLFAVLGIMGTYLGIPYKGSIVNIRNASIVVASISCGPVIGGIAGLIAGIHRLLYSSGENTALACAIATILSGVLPGILYKKHESKDNYTYAIFCTIAIESFSMILIGIICPLGEEIIRNIYIPMILVNSIGIWMMMTILDNILKEKERIEAEQAKVTLDIANRTLPYFKEVNEESLKKVCKIIRSSLEAEVVVITDKQNILSYSSRDDVVKICYKEVISNYTKKAINEKKTIILNDKDEKLSLEFDIRNVIKSAIITPLLYDNEIIGTLKVYFNKDSYITDSHKHLVLGLSTLISTQIQLGKIKEYEKMANKAEIKALQSQINPHFLFNSLHAITSFVRVDPDKARELIVNLSDYLRYNLEVNENFIELRKEIEQVKAYVSIQEARFPRKFKVHYDIKNEDMNIKIPPLIIEPLVENAIKHGILKNATGSNIWIKVKKEDEDNIIVIQDDGIGIQEDIIRKINEKTIEDNKIGLYNVHCRVKLSYGKGLDIERLKNGTRISFKITN